MATRFRINSAAIVHRLLRGMTEGRDRVLSLLILDQLRTRISLVLPPNGLAEVDLPGVLLNGALPVESERLFSAQVFSSWVFVAMEEGGGSMNMVIELNPNADGDFVMIPVAAGVPPMITLQTELRDVDDFDVQFDVGVEVQRPAFGISPDNFYQILLTVSNEDDRADTGGEMQIVLRPNQQVILFRMGNFTFPLNTAAGVLLLPEDPHHHTGWLANFQFHSLFYMVSMGLEHALEGNQITIRGTYIVYRVWGHQYQGTVRLFSLGEVQELGD